jgi:Lrp/AsnC family transcriptional regulator, leucine-responsive regulatory protein
MVKGSSEPAAPFCELRLAEVDFRTYPAPSGLVLVNYSVTELDRIDLRILSELLSDARASQIDLAEKVGLSPTACARRVRQLEEAGIIRGYRADLEPTALGLVTTVVVTITLEKQSEDYLAAFEAAIARCPDVVSCHLMSGSDDYHLQVIARDIADFERIHKQHLSRMPGVARIHSSFAMREVVRRAVPETALRR